MRTILALALLAAGCRGAAPPAPPAAAAPAAAVPRGEELFRAAAVEGSFVLLSLDSGEVTIVGPARADTAYLPASTFKIPSALVALETGVLSGAGDVLPWDGRPREIAAWNRDHDLATAIRDSVVWYFQEVARRIGQERMDHYLRAFSYGNMDTGGGIDRFWLDGQLRISPRQQVEFMRRLRGRELPLRREVMEEVERLLVRAQGPGWAWRGKTGLGAADGAAVGWLVGLVDRDGRAWAYALVVLASEDEEERLIPLRRSLARELLIQHGALPPDACP